MPHYVAFGRIRRVVECLVVHSRVIIHVISCSHQPRVCEGMAHARTLSKPFPKQKNAMNFPATLTAGWWMVLCPNMTMQSSE